MTLHDPQLDIDGRKGRYGVAYLDTLVTAAGYDLNEPRPGADMLAYDASVIFPEGAVRVQIKTTHKYAMDGSNERLTYTATPHWVESWATAMSPVYFLVVVVPHDVDGGPWLNYHSSGTDMLKTAAYWSRIDARDFSAENMSVAALRSQRLDLSTLSTWRDDLIRGYGG
jgi:hypothetical protein